MANVNPIKPFQFYCQPVLPLVYDDSLSYYETLCKVVGQLNTTGDTVNQLNEGLTQEISERQSADAALGERLAALESASNKTHFMVFSGGNPTSAMPTRTELWNWVREGDIICALYGTNEPGRNQVYAASCSYNAGDWGTENSNDFHFLIPLETTYDSTGKLATKQKIAKLTIPSYAKQTLNTPWGEEIIEVNTPNTSAEGMVNITASVSGETVTASISPTDFISLFDTTSPSGKLCVGVNARLNYNSLELSSSVATVYDSSSSKREVRITFLPEPHAGSRDYAHSEIVSMVNIVGDKTSDTWKVEAFGTELFDFNRYSGFQFTRKTGDVVEAAEDSDPATVAQYFNELHDKDYQNLPVHLIDEVDNADYWNGTFDSYADGHITFTFITSNYATIGETMVVRVIELSATNTGGAWTGAEKWSYAAKEFDVPYRPTLYVLDVWQASDTPEIVNGYVSYTGGSNLDFDDLLPLVSSNQNFVATLHKGDSDKGIEWSGLVYSSKLVNNGIGSITFSTLEGVTLLNGIRSMRGIVVFSKNSDGVKNVAITFSSALPAPASDNSDNGKTMVVNGSEWKLTNAPTGFKYFTYDAKAASADMTPAQVKSFIADNPDTPIYMVITNLNTNALPLWGVPQSHSAELLTFAATELTNNSGQQRYTLVTATSDTHWSVVKNGYLITASKPDITAPTFFDDDEAILGVGTNSYAANHGRPYIELGESLELNGYTVYSAAILNTALSMAVDVDDTFKLSGDGSLLTTYDFVTRRAIITVREEEVTSFDYATIKAELDLKRANIWLDTGSNALRCVNYKAVGSSSYRLVFVEFATNGDLNCYEVTVSASAATVTITTK